MNRIRAIPCQMPNPIGRAGTFGAALLLSWVLLCGLACQRSSAVTIFDGFIHEAPSLYVYSDGDVKTQKLDISGSWWSDFKQAYAKRVNQGIGWPTDFVPVFESFMANGSWAVMMEESTAGITISLFGTDDPNAFCDFSEPTLWAPSGEFGCTAHAGYDFASAGYFTHNSYGTNGCGYTVDVCADNGMAVYSAPTTGHADVDNRFWLTRSSGSVSSYIMNFDVHYPDGYEGDRFGPNTDPELPPSDPPAPPSIGCGTAGLTCDPPTICPRVKIVGVRGSGETTGLGKIVGGFSKRLVNRLRTRFPGVSDLYYEVPVSYEAIEIEKALSVDSSSGRLVATKYRLSVDSGIEALDTVLSNDPCASSSQYVLAGYSQGAHVVGDVLTKRIAKSTLARVRAVVLFGDPKFNPEAKEIKKFGGFDPNLDGVRGGRKSGSLNVLKNRVFSFCRKGDIVCQWRLSDYVAHKSSGIKQHEKYGQSEFDTAASKVAPLIK